MPNGRPGDHPYTDIVRHDIDRYTTHISDLVRAIDEYGDGGAKKRAQSLLWETADPSGAELTQLENALQDLCAEIERADNYPVESPLEGCLTDTESVYTASIRELVRDVHAAIHDEVDNHSRARAILSALLWEAGWEPDDLSMVETTVREFRADHWIMNR